MDVRGTPIGHQAEPGRGQERKCPASPIVEQSQRLHSPKVQRDQERGHDDQGMAGASQAKAAEHLPRGPVETAGVSQQDQVLQQMGDRRPLGGHQEDRGGNNQEDAQVEQPVQVGFLDEGLQEALQSGKGDGLHGRSVVSRHFGQIGGIQDQIHLGVRRNDLIQQEGLLPR